MRRSDLDVVNHVNNTRYVGWAVESVPDTVWESHHPTAFPVDSLKDDEFYNLYSRRTMYLSK